MEDATESDLIFGMELEDTEEPEPGPESEEEEEDEPESEPESEDDGKGTVALGSPFPLCMTGMTGSGAPFPSTLT